MDGKEFEAAYVRAQTEGHQKLLRIQEKYLASGKDPPTSSLPSWREDRSKSICNCWQTSVMTTTKTPPPVAHPEPKSNGVSLRAASL